MRIRPMFLFPLFVVLCSAASLLAQQTEVSSVASNSVASSVPRLIKFSGTLLDEQGQPMKSPVGVTFTLYAQQSGGGALWMETQNVETDARGNYTVLLGANSPNGIPLELFNTVEARWLGAQAEHQPEQPRVLLVSVPYALKAGDAQTLGGLPASAFAQLGASSSSVPTNTTAVVPLAAAATSASSASPLASTCTAITADGTAPMNQMAKFAAPCQIHQSQIFDNGTSIGIGTSTPVTKLDVAGGANIQGQLSLPRTGLATSTMGFPSQSLDFLASAWNTSGTPAAVNQHFRWQAEPVRNNTASPSGRLNLLFGTGTATPGETGLSISNKGIITFAPGQTLPTVTGNETVTGNFAASGSISGATGNFVSNSSSQVISVAQNGTGNGLAVSSSDGFAVIAESKTGVGVFAVGSTAVEGTSPVPNGAGVVGVSGNSTGVGVHGVNNVGGLAGQFDGLVQVNGSSTGAMSITTPGNLSTATTALTVSNTEGTLVQNFAVDAHTSSTTGIGVKGTSGPSSTTGTGALSTAGLGATGVWGDSVDNAGVLGTADDGIGVFAENNPPPHTNIFSPALLAMNLSTIPGANVFQAFGAPIDPSNPSGGLNSCRVDVSGNLICTGQIIAPTLVATSSKDFKIDHPLDPANKYLVHASVESSELMNIYSGNVLLDGSGAATVQLPRWFQAENGDFRYQLTSVGAPARDLYIADEISGNQFKIAGGKPGGKVSWQVTALREDAPAKAHPLIPEQEKSAADRGHYLHPELYGTPATQGIGYVPPPALSRRPSGPQSAAP